jgi:outer membrane protein assembly factor BamB
MTEFGTSASDILRKLDLPDGARVVVYDWLGCSAPVENLVCLNSDGTIRWRAKLPENAGPSDCFVAVRMDGDLLLANTWSCYAVWLDPKTGETLRQSFTK